MNGKSVGIGFELQFAVWEFSDTWFYACGHGEIISNTLKYIYKDWYIKKSVHTTNQQMVY
jgi:hypothetical protein